MRKIINLALALALTMGLCVPAFAAGNSFSDVPAGHWAYPYITKAAEAGWVNGMGDGSYNPDGQVTYAQFCVMLAQLAYSGEAAGLSSSRGWWEPYYQVCYTHGVLNAVPCQQPSTWGAYADRGISRADMACMLYCLMQDKGTAMPSDTAIASAKAAISDYRQLSFLEQASVSACYALGLLSGFEDNSFRPKDTMTRAQAAVVLCKLSDLLDGTTSAPAPETPSTPVEDHSTVTFAAAPVATQGRGARTVVKCTVAGANRNDDFTFRIEPAENYGAAVVMPSDCYATVFGAGTAEFAPIEFTEAGTYKFAITECDDGGNYRYDARTWTLTVTVEGEEVEAPLEKPEGALGGQYDTSVYNVPADTNKDSWITEAEVLTVINDFIAEHPVGSQWGDETTYYSSTWGLNGGGCTSFAMMLSDNIFGNLPKRTISDAYSVRVGDVFRVLGTYAHWSVMYDSWWYDEDPSQGDVTTYDGNVGGKVGKGGMTYQEIEDSLKVTGGNGMLIYTRYPLETSGGGATTTELSVSSFEYALGDETNTDNASFITVGLDMPGWSSSTIR